MNKFLKVNFLAIAIALLIIPFFIISNVYADNAPLTGKLLDYSSTEPSEGNRLLDRMTDVAGRGKYVTDEGAASVPRIVGLIINALLSITGLIFIILTVFAGFNWMTSNGNEEKIKKSIDTLKASVIGLIVTLSAWTIWNFIFANLIL